MHIIKKKRGILIKKVCVYAICKNESKFIDRWYESIKDADGIYVLDTGSTDDSVKKFIEHNITVMTKEISPWRFDVARNESLKLIPEDMDICVCLDIDEIMLPGWKENILKLWQDDTTRLRYVYNWYIDDEGNPKITFYADKIHKRKDAKWVNAVHEVLKFPYPEKQIFTDDVTINHYPDKTKSRSSYLPLLEISVKEDPENDRNTHYLGREYMYYGKWNDAIDTLIKHLSLKRATWKDERCASMRFIARCYTHLNRYEEAKMWLEKACQEAPHLRDPFVESAILYYTLKDYPNVIKYAKKALTIKENGKSYINEIFSYDETTDDLLSIAYYYENDLDKAIKYAKQAIKINPNNQRIKDNLEFFNQAKSKTT